MPALEPIFRANRDEPLEIRLADQRFDRSPAAAEQIAVEPRGHVGAHEDLERKAARRGKRLADGSGQVGNALVADVDGAEDVARPDAVALDLPQKAPREGNIFGFFGGRGGWHRRAGKRDGTQGARKGADRRR